MIVLVSHTPRNLILIVIDFLDQFLSSMSLQEQQLGV